MKLLHVVGARPNFMKVAPVLRAGRRVAGLTQVLVHTGQHYDESMSDAFFRDLDLPAPDENLEVGSGTHAEQTARIILGFEPVLLRHRPDWVLVYGDVNSTLAGALVAAKLGIRIAHVEAGLRSRDRNMPEEINRILTDQVADLCFTPSRDGDKNLRAEGISPRRIRMVGNVMVDTLLQLLDRARMKAMPKLLGVKDRDYAFVTLHRPSNVDDRASLDELLRALEDIGERMTVLFAVHPRTRRRIQEFGLALPNGNVRLLDPLGYLETVSLLDQATVVLTDSGGLQEETTVLGVPCLTARANTERPVTIKEGTNRLVASTRAAIRTALDEILAARARGAFRPGRPEGWDGHAGERVIAAVTSDQ